MIDQVTAEIHDLHAFFVGWFRGELPAEPDGLRRFLEVTDADFVLVPPTGLRVQQAPLCAALTASHATRRGQVFRIEARVREVREIGPGLAVAWYEEWQTTGEGERGRISSALFAADPGTPHGVRWLHVHETWLPTKPD